MTLDQFFADRVRSLFGQENRTGPDFKTLVSILVQPGWCWRCTFGGAWDHSKQRSCVIELCVKRVQTHGKQSMWPTSRVVFSKTLHLGSVLERLLNRTCIRTTTPSPYMIAASVFCTRDHITQDALRVIVVIKSAVCFLMLSEGNRTKQQLCTGCRTGCDRLFGKPVVWSYSS